MTDIVNSTSEDVNTSQENIDFNASDFAPASSIPERTEPEPEINPPKPAKPKSWKEDKRLAVIVLVIGLIIIGVVFYYLFKNAGII